DGKVLWGVGIDSNSMGAAVNAVVSAANRARRPDPTACPETGQAEPADRTGRHLFPWHIALPELLRQRGRSGRHAAPGASRWQAQPPHPVPDRRRTS
uniref:hypothetical protein n=1 Tax=Kitasatospora sp. MBT63 TaxID=1444768 RepID=UPI00053A6C24